MGVELQFTLVPESPQFLPSPERLERWIHDLARDGWIPTTDLFGREVEGLGSAFTSETYDFRARNFRDRHEDGSQVLDAAYWRAAAAGPSELWLHIWWYRDIKDRSAVPWAVLRDDRFLLDIVPEHEADLWYTLRVRVSDNYLFAPGGADCDRCDTPLAMKTIQWEPVASPTCPECGQRFTTLNDFGDGTYRDAAPVYRFCLSLVIHAYDELCNAEFSPGFLAAMSSGLETELMDFVDVV